MFSIKSIPIIVCLLLPVLSISADVEEEKRLAKIKALEKEKNDLYKQINDAIDESVKNLEESNDTDARLGISLVTDLKKQLELFNGTNTDAMIEMLNFTVLQNDTRRSSNHKNRGKDFEDDLEMKVMHGYGKKYEDRLAHRGVMQQRIEDWLKKKAEEKSKIKKYIQKGRSHKPEKCPDFGVHKKFKKKKFKGWVPCCRKCCKKSYMGCLK